MEWFFPARPHHDRAEFVEDLCTEDRVFPRFESFSSNSLAIVCLTGSSKSYEYTTIFVSTRARSLAVEAVIEFFSAGIGGPAQVYSFPHLREGFLASLSRPRLSSIGAFGERPRREERSRELGLLHRYGPDVRLIPDLAVLVESFHCE